MRLFLLLACLLASPSVNGQQKVDHYVTTVKGKVTIESGGTLTMTSKSVFDYQIQRSIEKWLYILDQLQMDVSTNETQIIDMVVNKNQFVVSSSVVAKKGDSSELGKALAAFEEPFLETVLDDDRQPVKNRVLKTEVNDSLLIQTRDYLHMPLFHGPFDHSKDTWTHPVQYSVGGGGYLSGQMHYRRLSSKDDQCTVQISTSLNGDTRFDNYDCTAKCELKGTQVYDLTKKAWVSGKATAHNDITLRRKGQETSVGNASVELNYVHQRKTDAETE